ncbi:TrmH family RNA methyltransferase [Ignavibacterium album JCM 16511]|uniref:TrmH family RNA methyltransferase n=1 Tax=Ignavibacterium album (strain DSM 19864 / JCM 16511 / NBRC 101810 / Mat9-16) TaxID=945713 RepID=I0AI66_IGNAJ|nr:RNA methyltransferase [Ignavibacterium album]AFH48673.1 TrmH family RNA methyltransferase [Ignavibacterium album JCM 16511]
MITRNELKYYASLSQKKFRESELKFVAEGLKNVTEGLKSHFTCEIILTTFEFAEQHKTILNEAKKKKVRIETIRSQDFIRISETKSPQGIAAVFKYGKLNFYPDKTESKILVYLDNISDPGNLGTIIRTCDWFGINEILISKFSVDYLNPKAIRASMGSIFHLYIFEELDSEVLADLQSKNFKIICSDLDGKNLFEFKFPEKFVLVFSNEAVGPSDWVKKIADEIITIPKIGNAESLNVAIASGIILSRALSNQTTHFI